MVGVMFTCLRQQGGLGLPLEVTSLVERFAMGPTPSAMAVQKELTALPSGLISAAERQVARGIGHDLSQQTCHTRHGCPTKPRGPLLS